MHKPETPLHESDRLAALQQLEILGSASEPAFDNITALLATLCDAPVAMIGLTDSHRHWFKSVYGITEICEIPRAESFCECTVTGGSLLEVPDARLDPRFCRLPLVTGPLGVRFYAGVPLVAASGAVLGSLCVLDTVPRRLAPWQREALSHLANTVIALLESRKRERDLARYATLLENTGDEVFLVDGTSMCYVHANETACRNVQYSVESLRERSPVDLLVPASVDTYYQCLNQLLGGEVDYVTCEVRRRRRDGTCYEAELRIRKASYSGRPYFVVTGGDITKRRQTELALRREQALLDRVMLTVPAGVFVLDAEGRFIFANPAAYAILGLAEEDINALGYHYLSFSPRSLAGMPLPPAERPFEVVRSTGKTVEDAEMIVRRPDGKDIIISMSCSPLFDEAGNFSGAVTIIDDVTKRRQAELTLRQTQEQFRLLVEGATDYAFMMLDREGCIKTWSPGAGRLFGYFPEEVVGRHIRLTYCAEDIAQGLFGQQLHEAERCGRVEHDRWQVRKDGTRFWGSGVLTALRDDAGEVRGFVKVIRDSTARRLAAEKTTYLSRHDTLTGLPNRAYFNERLQEALAEAERDGKELAVLLLDLDHFKTINDTLGHHIGDLLLKEVGRRLCLAAMATDTVARLGGDEFVVILPDLAGVGNIGVLAERLVKELGQPYHLAGKEIHSSPSVGITVFPRDGQDAQQLLRNADMAMYHAKARGRNAWYIYTSQLRLEAHARKELEDDLRRAWACNEFEVYYQPQVDLAANTISGMEALLRWRHPDRGLVAPSLFMAAAEDTGLIVPIGEWVLREAFSQLSQWRELNLAPFRIAVNFSARQIKHKGFKRLIRQTLQEAKLDGRWFDLEITEGMLMEKTAANHRLLQELKEMGLRITIDDFGTGFSSLAYLKEFPVDALKIDKAFVKPLPGKQREAAIASAIISLAGHLGMDVVAEGVETPDQYRCLLDLGCARGQGFLFARPMSGEETTRWLREFSHQPSPLTLMQPAGAAAAPLGALEAG